MSSKTNNHVTFTLFYLLLVHVALIRCQIQVTNNSPLEAQVQPDTQQPASYPYYMQSPLQGQQPMPSQPIKSPEVLVQQHNRIPALNRPVKETAPSQSEINPAYTLPKTANVVTSNANCLYERRHFAELDQCLSRKPYPTIGLAAFKNEDLLIKRGLSERHGCQFLLNNGLFKNYQISKFALTSDGKCLDDSRIGISLGFTNLTLSYLWTLRCLNRADQLAEDATLNGATLNIEEADTMADNQQQTRETTGLCVGSSQSFGFASLLLSGVEAQVDLATDIYKNWRVTNVTVAMLSGGSGPAASIRPSSTGAESQAADQAEQPVLHGTNIRDFVFESLDGDELNWRYLHLFQNWTRNRMHTNFLDQYRRFLWVSLQRCLNEASQKLPAQLHDVFTSQKLN